jgi:2-methylcitrate dehydratase PrpD
MDAPNETLEAGDLFYRALVLEERGEYKQARELERIAEKGLYTSEYLQCWRSQME